MKVTNELIQKKALELVGTELHEIQLEWVHAIIAQYKGSSKMQMVSLPARRAGYTVAYKVAMAIVNDAIQKEKS